MFLSRPELTVLTNVFFFRSLCCVVVLACRWDEWVHPARLLKLNETNLALQKTLQQANAAATASAAGASSSAKAGTKGHTTKDGGRTTARKDGGTRGTKRGREEVRGDPNSFIPVLLLRYPAR